MALLVVSYYPSPLQDPYLVNDQPSDQSVTPHEAAMTTDQ